MTGWIAAIADAGARLTDAGHAALGRNPRSLMTVCAWCQRIMKWGQLPVSHGCCPSCVGRYFEKNELPAEELKV